MPKKKEDREALIKQIAREKGLSGTELNQFMAQVKKETGNFKKFEESAYYSVERMREMFPSKTKGKSDKELKKISPKYDGSKEKFFDFVYSNRKNLGTGDKEGSKYYGRGPIQLTGKYNYQKYKADPAKMDDLRYATEKSVDYFKDITKNVKNKKDADEYSSKINKYDTGSFDQRKKYFKEYEEEQEKLDIRQAEGNTAFGNTESFKKLMEKRKEEDITIMERLLNRSRKE